METTVNGFSETFSKALRLTTRKLTSHLPLLVIYGPILERLLVITEGLLFMYKLYQMYIYSEDNTGKCV